MWVVPAKSFGSEFRAKVHAFHYGLDIISYFPLGISTYLSIYVQTTNSTQLWERYYGLKICVHAHNLYIEVQAPPLWPWSNKMVCVYVCVCISRSVLVCLFVTPRTVAFQASLSMELSRQEYWSGLPFPSPEELPNPGNELWSPASQADSLPFELQGSLIRSNKITVLIKRDTRDLVCSLSATWGHHEKAVTYKPWKEASEWKITCWHLDLRRLGF